MITLEPPRGIDAETRPWEQLGLSAPGLGRFLRAAQKAVGLDGEVHVLLADDATLRRLNRTFRGKNKATDVLSFPAGGVAEGNAASIAGDLAISLETAGLQASVYGHSLRDEVRVLLLHGVLHLAGFDHEVDSGEMAAREAKLRRKLRLATSLIERVTDARTSRTKTKNKQKRNTGILRSTQNDKPKVGTRRSAQDDGPKKGKPQNAAKRRWPQA
jgi:probable rRNA maturation factor